MQFQLVDVFTSTPYRGNSLSVFPDAGGLSTTQMAQITGELRQFESIFLNPAGPQHHWRARIFDLFEELDFAGHPVIGAACRPSPSARRRRVHGRWTLELASGALTVETERRGPAAFHAVLPDMAAHFLGEPLISRARRWRRGSRCPTATSTLACPSKWSLPVCAISSCRFAMERSPAPASRTANSTWRWPRLGAEYAYLLDAEAGEGRHWNNDGVVEDAATGSAAGCVAAYLHRHGLLGEDHAAELRQGRFINRPSRISISARSVGGGIRSEWAARSSWWDRAGWTCFPRSRRGAR